MLLLYVLGIRLTVGSSGPTKASCFVCFLLVVAKERERASSAVCGDPVRVSVCQLRINVYKCVSVDGEGAALVTAWFHPSTPLFAIRLYNNGLCVLRARGSGWCLSDCINIDRVSLVCVSTTIRVLYEPQPCGGGDVCFGCRNLE